MSPHKRKDVVVSDSDEEEEDGPTVTAHKKRLGRLRRAGSFAAAAHDVKDLCEDEDGTAARPTQAPLAPPLRAPPPAHSLQAPTPQRRTAIRERASSAKKDRERALARLARRRLHSGEDDADEEELDAGGSSSSSGGSERGNSRGEEGCETNYDSDASFIVPDEEEEEVQAALDATRAMTGGRAMDEGGRLEMYAHLRLLRLLGALPAARSVAGEVKASIGVALNIERGLQQKCEEMHNLEHMRRADPDLKERLEECEVVETRRGGYRMGKHCCYCRHDRRRRICMLELRFGGQRRPVDWLEPILRAKDLLPGAAESEDGMRPAHEAMGVGSDSGSGSDNGSSNGSSSSSNGSSGSDEDELLIAGYKRRLALCNAETPLRARQVARQLAEAAANSDDDSLLGSAALQRAGWQRQQRRRQQPEQVVRKQRLLSPSSGASGEAKAEGEGEDEERSDSGQQFAGEQGSEDEAARDYSDPSPSDSSASDGGKRPRRRPRIGVDCWARAFVYRAMHRYPARLDSMLLYWTRRYLAKMAEEEQPYTLAGLAHRVLQRYGHAMRKHHNAFMYPFNGFNMLQNKTSNKTGQNVRIMEEMKGLLIASCVRLTPEEERSGVDIRAELAAFEAAARRRRQQPGAAAVAAEEEDQGRGGLLLLQAAAQPEEEEVERKRSQRTHEVEHDGTASRYGSVAAPLGGQRAAAAVAAAAATFGYARQADERQRYATPKAGGVPQAATPATAAQEQPQRVQELVQREQRQGERSRPGKCFMCGSPGHWRADCPVRRGRCFNCGQCGHWAADCPNR